jgi:hypothetical protein
MMLKTLLRRPVSSHECGCRYSLSKKHFAAARRSLLALRGLRRVAIFMVAIGLEADIDQLLLTSLDFRVRGLVN